MLFGFTGEIKWFITSVNGTGHCGGKASLLGWAVSAAGEKGRVRECK